MTDRKCDFEGKRCYTLKDLKDLKETYSNLNFVDGKRFNGRETEEEIVSWIKQQF